MHCNNMYITCSNKLSFYPSFSVEVQNNSFLFSISLSHLLEHYELHKKNKEKDTEGGGVSANDIIQLILDESDPVSWTVLSLYINLPLITTEG